MHSLEVKLATPAHWARVSNILHNILERILMYVIASWPLVLATCALLRHVNVNEANMNGDHFTTVHCVIIMELDEATLMDGTAPPCLARGTVSVHCWCPMSFTDRHLIFRDKVYGTGGPKLRVLWSKICVNIDHPSHPPKNI